MDYELPLSVTVAYFIKKSLQMTGLIRNGYPSQVLGREQQTWCQFDSRLIVHSKDSGVKFNFTNRMAKHFSYLNICLQ